MYTFKHIYVHIGNIFLNIFSLQSFFILLFYLVLNLNFTLWFGSRSEIHFDWLFEARHCTLFELCFMFVGSIIYLATINSKCAFGGCE